MTEIQYTSARENIYVVVNICAGGNGEYILLLGKYSFLSCRSLSSYDNRLFLRNKMAWKFFSLAICAFSLQGTP